MSWLRAARRRADGAVRQRRRAGGGRFAGAADRHPGAAARPDPDRPAGARGRRRRRAGRAGRAAVAGRARAAGRCRDAGRTGAQHRRPLARPHSGRPSRRRCVGSGRVGVERCRLAATQWRVGRTAPAGRSSGGRSAGPPAASVGAVPFGAVPAPSIGPAIPAGSPSSARCQAALPLSTRPRGEVVAEQRLGDRGARVERAQVDDRRTQGRARRAAGCGRRSRPRAGRGSAGRRRGPGPGCARARARRCPTKASTTSSSGPMLNTSPTVVPRLVSSKPLLRVTEARRFGLLPRKYRTEMVSPGWCCPTTTDSSSPEVIRVPSARVITSPALQAGLVARAARDDLDDVGALRGCRR